MKSLEVYITDYVGPSNTKGTRIKVTNPITGKRRFFTYDHSLDARGNHLEAVKKIHPNLDTDIHDRTQKDDGSGFVVVLEVDWSSNISSWGRISN